ncbi:MAG: glycosyltransferase family A protein, partial [Bacteroidota bacterium]
LDHRATPQSESRRTPAFSHVPCPLNGPRPHPDMPLSGDSRPPRPTSRLAGRLAVEEELAAEHQESTAPKRPRLHGTPLVSCIMPTADRREFVPYAIQRFLAQTYPQKELVIVDDGHQSCEDLIPAHPEIYYFRHPGGITLGEKRNHCIAQTRGSILHHWDDDDWTHPNWLNLQVGWLMASDADIVGLANLYFYDPVHRQAWQYDYPPIDPAWVHGATLCYRRDFWRDNPFPPLDEGEDCRFLWTPQPKKIEKHSGKHLFAATVHTTNASEKSVTDSRWTPQPYTTIEEMLGPDLPEIREILLARQWR